MYLNVEFKYIAMQLRKINCEKGYWKSQMGVNLNLTLTQHFQHATLDSMDWVANLFVSVTKITPFHVTLLMDTATVFLDGLGKSALYVSRFD